MINDVDTFLALAYGVQEVQYTLILFYFLCILQGFRYLKLQNLVKVHQACEGLGLFDVVRIL